MRIPPSKFPGILLLVVPAFAAVAFAQQPPPVPTPHTPNLLGIYPGMPMQAGVSQLQKQSSDVYVSVNSQGFSLVKSSPNSSDAITASVTHPPVGPPAVWMISRVWYRAAGAGMTVSALLSALHAKYGPETMRKTEGNGSIWLYWIFDPNGNLLSHADPVLMGCNADALAPSMDGAPDFNPAQAPCYKSFFAVTVNFVVSPSNPITNGYRLELVNLPYAARAAMIAANAKNAAANQARQEQLQRAKRNVPTF